MMLPTRALPLALALALAGTMATTTSSPGLSTVPYKCFLALLEYLYTDMVDVQLDIAMDLFQAADQFGVDRLKKICESKMLSSINVENAASIFHAADLHNALGLREKCLTFILHNFDAVTKTICFEEMGRGKALHTTECGHSYHFGCLKEWGYGGGKENCPLCRRDFAAMSTPPKSPIVARRR